MDENKTEGQKLFEKLSYTAKNAWENAGGEREEAFKFCDGYKRFLDAAKTEREFSDEVEKMARKNGFIPLQQLLDLNKKPVPGTKIYYINRNKSAILCIVGNKPLTEGLNIIGSHIDSPRIDLKQNPLYEDTGIALLKTHYYGGIKKYQWVTIPLALHGIIVKGDGNTVKINIGESQDDPVFTITDLLPHLAADQMQKKASEVVAGEALNILLGSEPYNDDKVKEKVKLNILKILKEKYDIIEEDFISAELEIVPEFKARDIGIDRSMIGAYGQDDRACAYPSLKALLELGIPERTSVCLLTDKEEIGSTGNTGAQSTLLKDFLAYLCAYTVDNYTDIKLVSCLRNSKMLSADVNAAVDPNFEGLQDKKNATYLGRGIVLQKYTGVKGKYDGSDANAEFVGEIRRLLNNNGIIWQTGELGKVDQGGGGTIAMFAANLGIDVIDCGVAVLSMHSPFEITSKIDIFTSYKAYKVFYNSK
jgi:aspartyl aminopeptidase